MSGSGEKLEVRIGPFKVAGNGKDSARLAFLISVLFLALVALGLVHWPLSTMLEWVPTHWSGAWHQVVR